MLEHLRDGFSTMTDLADTLVKTYDLSFRQAHNIIVDVTVEALRMDKKAEDITQDMINRAAEKVVGRTLMVPVNKIQQSVDPRLNVKRRKVRGGPAPESVRKMIDTQRNQLTNDEKNQIERTSKINKALTLLKEAEKALDI
jgi:argininosuccinate lyase